MWDALKRTGRGERWRVDDASPLGHRLRTVAAEAHAAHRSGIDVNARTLLSEQDRKAWQRRANAGRALLALLHLPLRDAAGTVLSQRLDPHWRDELTADLRADPGE